MWIKEHHLFGKQLNLNELTVCLNLAETYCEKKHTGIIFSVTSFPWTLEPQNFWTASHVINVKTYLKFKKVNFSWPSS